MRTEEIPELYDESYARRYDDRFIYDKDYKHVTDFEIEVLAQFLSCSESWLDVGCGTGYFLSKFPDKARAGLDLSEGMLTVARERNNGALFMEQGDFRTERPQWSRKWDLVSCMWCAYCYVESMSDVDTVIRNLSDWTSDDGICFLPICDLEDVLYFRGELEHYNPNIEIFGGPCYVNGVVWTYIDSLHNKKHENLISPHIEYLIRLLKESFSKVEIIYYPPYPFPIPGQRKALIASGKRGSITQGVASAFEGILAKSQVHRANVLTMEKIQEINRASNSSSVADGKDSSTATSVEPPQDLLVQNTTASKQTAVSLSGEEVGWLRNLWRKTPPSVRNAIRKCIGER